MMNPPEKTIDLFEKNLAFAIALDCEVEWGKKFEHIIETAVQEGTVHAGLYYSNFHAGAGFSGSAFASSFGSAISSASTPPSSSSGGGSSFGAAAVVGAGVVAEVVAGNYYRGASLHRREKRIR